MTTALPWQTGTRPPVPFAGLKDFSTLRLGTVCLPAHACSAAGNLSQGMATSSRRPPARHRGPLMRTRRSSQRRRELQPALGPHPVAAAVSPCRPDVAVPELAVIADLLDDVVRPARAQPEEFAQ